MASTTHARTRSGATPSSGSGGSSGGGARVQVQRFGTFLSNMVLPNIGAFIAWGLITALFIETGWVTLIGGKPGLTTGGYGFVEQPRRLGRQAPGARRAPASSVR